LTNKKIYDIIKKTYKERLKYMGINYDKLWKLLIDKKLKKTDLKNLASLSTHTLAKLGKGEAVDMVSLIKICNTLKCSLSEIVEYTPDLSEAVKT
jgi:DNA (cytosine-5)-methyltransferase 1